MKAIGSVRNVRYVTTTVDASSIDISVRLPVVVLRMPLPYIALGSTRIYNITSCLSTDTCCSLLIFI